MLSEATSGFNCNAGCRRSSIVIVAAPPVVKLMTTSERRLMSAANSRKYFGSCVGWPSTGSRACRCTIAAPASAAPTAASAISRGVTGRCGDIDGVWIEPVMAQVMMTLRASAMVFAPRSVFGLIALVPRERQQTPVAPVHSSLAFGPPTADRPAPRRRARHAGLPDVAVTADRPRAGARIRRSARIVGHAAGHIRSWSRPALNDHGMKMRPARLVLAGASGT